MTDMPKWWKNTFFWIAFILFCIGIIGLPFFGGDKAIRDPGQEPESYLYLIYFGGAIVAWVNGWMSHRLTYQQYLEPRGK